MFSLLYDSLDSFITAKWLKPWKIHHIFTREIYTTNTDVLIFSLLTSDSSFVQANSTVIFACLSDAAFSSIPSRYQVDPMNLRLEESSLLGHGNFGIVFKGHLRRGTEWVPVAVKQTSNLPSKEDMVLEAKLML